MDRLSSLSSVPQQANQHGDAQRRGPSLQASGVALGLLLVWIFLGGLSQVHHRRSFWHTGSFVREPGAWAASWNGRWSLHCGSAALHGSTSRRCASHISTIASRFFAWVFARCAFFSRLCRALHGFHVVVTAICFCLSSALPHSHDVPIGCALPRGTSQLDSVHSSPRLPPSQPVSSPPSPTYRFSFTTAVQSPSSQPLLPTALGITHRPCLNTVAICAVAPSPFRPHHFRLCLRTCMSMLVASMQPSHLHRHLPHHLRA